MEFVFLSLRGELDPFLSCMLLFETLKMYRHVNWNIKMPVCTSVKTFNEETYNKKCHLQLGRHFIARYASQIYEDVGIKIKSLE